MERLRENVKTEYLTAGANHVISINSKKEIWNWGAGEYGVFGDGQNKNYNVPVMNSCLMDINSLQDEVDNSAH